MDAQGRSQDRPRPDDRLLSAAPCSLLECVHMILMNDFKAEPAEIRTAMTDAAARVFASGWYVLGQEVKAFEERWAETCGTPHCIGVGHGMDAIRSEEHPSEIGEEIGRESGREGGCTYV